MRRLLLCVISVAALAACGAPATNEPVANAPAVAAAPTTAAVARPVPDSLAFSAPRVGGGTVNLADYAGTTVLLWFWAPT